MAAPGNPYAAPVASIKAAAPASKPFRWWRIPLWGALILVFVIMVHLVGSSLLMTWSTNPEYIRTGLAMRSLLLNLAAGAVAYALYLLFLHGTGRHAMWQVLGVFLVLQALNIPMALAMKVPLASAFSLLALAANLAVCLLAYLTWLAISSVRR